MQNVIAEDRPEVGNLSVVVLKTADRKSKILRVLAPLGVLLPNGLGLNVDGKDIDRAYFVRCFADGCYAEVVLEDELLKTFRSGASATFIVFQTPEEGIGIPVDLKGFAEGYDRASLIRACYPLYGRLCDPYQFDACSNRPRDLHPGRKHFLPQPGFLHNAMNTDSHNDAFRRR